MRHTTTVGTTERAQQIADYHHGAVTCEPNEVEYLAEGSQRTVYLDCASDVVYKLGDDSANRHEVRVLTELRAEGINHAPAATLYEVDIDTEWGERITRTVVAMPYLPDDGSLPRPYPLLRGAADLNAGNVHANGGRFWLIDAGGM